MNLPLHLLLLTALAATPALAQQHDMASHGADTGMMAGMDKMNHDMAAVPMTGNADRDFAAMMIPHHQGAIDMAQAELRHGKDPAMRKLATDVIAAQTKEIAMMHRWLAAHPAH